MQSIAAIEKYLQGVSKETFLDSEEKQDLLVRRLEVIGESVKQLPEDFKRQYSDVPWRDIGDMRNVLIHIYFDVDYTIVWKTATELVPQLKKQIETMLKN